MRSTYENKTLSKGRSISIRTTEVDYTLPRIMETQKVWDEESERWRTIRVERRPDLHITTKVVCSKNRFGHVRLYGPQGVQ